MSDPVSRGDGFRRFLREPAKPTFSKPAAIALGVGAILVGGVTVRSNLAEGEWLQAALGAALALFFALVGFGLIPERDPRGSFRYINATVMTRAERPTADSWVHLAPTRGMRWPMVLAWAWAALFFAAMSVYAVLVVAGVAPRLNERTSEGGYLLALLPLLLITAFCGWIAVLLIGRRIRNGSFGTRPSGVALGENGLAVNVPGRDVEIPWVQIRSITGQRIILNETGGADLLLPRRPRGQAIDIIRLSLHTGGETTAREQLLSATGYTVPTDALYTAIAWYHEHSEARWELGRIEGERRLEGWRRRSLADPLPE